MLRLKSTRIHEQVTNINARKLEMYSLYAVTFVTNREKWRLDRVFGRIMRGTAKEKIHFAIINLIVNNVSAHSDTSQKHVSKHFYIQYNCINISNIMDYLNNLKIRLLSSQPGNYSA